MFAQPSLLQPNARLLFAAAVGLCALGVGRPLAAQPATSATAETPASPATTKAPTPEPERAASPPNYVWFLGGIATALALPGPVFLAHAGVTERQVAAGAEQRTAEELAALRYEADKHWILGGVFLGAGVVAGLTTVILAVTSEPDTEQPTDSVTATRSNLTVGWTLVPQLTTHGAGLGLSGRF